MLLFFFLSCLGLLVNTFSSLMVIYCLTWHGTERISPTGCLVAMQDKVPHLVTYGAAMGDCRGVDSGIGLGFARPLLHVSGLWFFFSLCGALGFLPSPIHIYFSVTFLSQLSSETGYDWRHFHDWGVCRFGEHTQCTFFFRDITAPSLDHQWLLLKLFDREKLQLTSTTSLTWWCTQHDKASSRR